MAKEELKPFNNLVKVVDHDVWITHKTIENGEKSFETYYCFLNDLKPEKPFTRVKIAKRAVEGCREFPKTNRSFKVKIIEGYLNVSLDTLYVVNFKRIFKEDELTTLPF